LVYAPETGPARLLLLHADPPDGDQQAHQANRSHFDMAEQVEDAAEVLLREENFVISDNDFKGYCHPFSFVERVDSELQEESLRILALYLFAVLYEVK